MPRFFEHLNILAMPTDACNMNCAYCFHKQHCNNNGFMSMDTLKQLVSITLPFYKKVKFLWHGGEPMLMGLDFYRNALKLQKGTTCRIENAIQTNLTLMTPEIAAFLCENKFGIGSSYDGIYNANLRGNDEAILRGRQMIIEQGGKCSFIMVVSQYNIDSLIDSYKFFKEKHINFTFNLYIDSKDFENSTLKLREDETIRRIKEFFIYWAHDANCTIEVSYFRRILEFILFRKKTICTYTSCLGRWVGVRHDGEIVPCNRYFPTEYSFGNVFDYSNIGEAFESEGFVNILSKAIDRRNKCKSCEIYDFCNGGCNHVAYNENGIDSNGGASCRIRKEIYMYIEDFVDNAIASQANDDTYNKKFSTMLYRARGKKNDIIFKRTAK